MKELKNHFRLQFFFHIKLEDLHVYTGITWSDKLEQKESYPRCVKKVSEED